MVNLQALKLVLIVPSSPAVVGKSSGEEPVNDSKFNEKIDKTVYTLH